MKNHKVEPDSSKPYSLSKEKKKTHLFINIIEHLLCASDAVEKYHSCICRFESPGKATHSEKEKICQP